MVSGPRKISNDKKTERRMAGSLLYIDVKA